MMQSGIEVMKLLSLLIIAIAVVAVMLYVFFPRVLFNQGRKALRRKGKMALKSIRVGDMTWPYLDGGNPDGEPVVLVRYGA